MKAFAIGLLLAFLATAADAGSLIIGAGSQTCTAWTNRKKNAVVKGSFESWLVRFISGLNVSGERKMVGGGDFDAITDRRCFTPSDRRIGIAALDLGVELARKAAKTIVCGRGQSDRLLLYLPFQFAERLLRNAFMPSRKSSLI
jgi:hypothetical protein